MTIKRIGATIATLVNDLKSYFVQKTGDTMTGDLNLDKHNVWIHSDDVDSSDETRAAGVYRNLGFKDANGLYYAFAQAAAGPDGWNGIQLYGRARNGTANVDNGLAIYAHPDGRRKVNVTDPKPWQDAFKVLPLSGGTLSGTLVLSKRQDLSGTANNSPALIVGGTASQTHIEIDDNEIQAKSDDTTPATLALNNDGGTVTVNDINITSVSTTTTVSTLATAATGFTITSCTAAVWGKVCTFTLTVKTTDGLAAGNITNTRVATLKAGYRPAVKSALSAADTGPVLTGHVFANGDVYVGATHSAVAANGAFSIGGTIVLA